MDKRWLPLAFAPGEHVFLKVSPKWVVMRFGKKGKLEPRFIGPFLILEVIGEVAYRLHCHRSLLVFIQCFTCQYSKKQFRDPSHIIDFSHLHITGDVLYEPHPVLIVVWRGKVLRGRAIYLVEVLWRHGLNEDLMWEREDAMRLNYPNLFIPSGTFISHRSFKFWGWDFLNWGGAEGYNAPGKKNFFFCYGRIVSLYQ